jgi:hypothetical protein
MTLGRAANLAAPPIRLVNLQTMEFKEAPAIPTKITRSIAVRYAKSAPHASSHSPLQYIGTDNQMISDVTFDLLTRTIAQARLIKDFMMYVESLCYSPGTSTEIEVEAPPDVVLIWPNYFSIVGKVVSFNDQPDMFFSDGSVKHRVLTLSMEETSPIRITQSAVRLLGPIRGPIVQ